MGVVNQICLMVECGDEERFFRRCCSRRQRWVSTRRRGFVPQPRPRSTSSGGAFARTSRRHPSDICAELSVGEGLVGLLVVVVLQVADAALDVTVVVQMSGL